MNNTPYILYIPEIALEKIFSYLTYDEIAKNRVVCRKFNEIGSNMLSRGFIQMEKRHAQIYKRVKSLLPRRESERRVHSLSRHCDILQAVETRISMLNMTYMRYIESNLLCFIPGKVLDEMLKVLNLVENDMTPLRTHQLLQELRDLSSMAMEHFDEHILPRVKEEMDDRRQSIDTLLDDEPNDFSETPLGFLAAYSNSATGLKPHKLLFVQQMFNNELKKMKRQYKEYKQGINSLKKLSEKLFTKIKSQSNRLKVQSVKIRDQERKIQEQSTKIQEQEGALADIKKHMDEWDQKYTDLTAELVKARDDMLLKSATTSQVGTSTIPPAHQPVTSTSVAAALPIEKFFKPSAKARAATATILSGKTAALTPIGERKRKSNLLPDISNIPIKACKNADDLLENCLPNFKQKFKSTGRHEFSSLLEQIIRTPITDIVAKKRKLAEIDV